MRGMSKTWWHEYLRAKTGARVIETQIRGQRLRVDRRETSLGTWKAFRVTLRSSGIYIKNSRKFLENYQMT